MLITTSEEKCQGCNKCIHTCPVQTANIAYQKNGSNKVKVNEAACISCGKCIKECDHHARDYIDDTEQFFTALLSGDRITVI